MVISNNYNSVEAGVLEMAEQNARGSVEGIQGPLSAGP